MELSNATECRVTITGISPLLLHADDVLAKDELDAERDKLKRTSQKEFSAGDDRCPPWTWRYYLHHDDDHVALPAEMLASPLAKAGARVTLKKPKSYKELAVCGVVFGDLYSPILVNGKPIDWPKIKALNGTFPEIHKLVRAMGFDLYVRRLTIGKGAKASKHVRVRPMFKTWSIVTNVQIVDPQLSAAKLQEIWTIAGLYFGYGDWRPCSPNNPGRFGRFTVTIA